MGGIIDRLAQIVRDPAEDPLGTAIAACLIVAVFIVVVLATLLLLPDTGKARRGGDAETTVPEPRSTRRKWIFRAGISLLVVVVLAGAVYGDRRTRQTAFCVSQCHILDNSVASWELGTHPNTDCIRCHSTPGVFGPIDTRVRGLSNWWSSVSGTEGLDTIAVVNQQGCRKCHTSEMKEEISNGAVRVRHSDFDTQISCSECHDRTGHLPSDDGVIEAEAVMNLCARCHDGTTAPSSCDTCHIGEVLLANAENDMGKIELPAPMDCTGGCHDLSACTKCHMIYMPHPPGWSDPKVHAPRGAFGLDPVCERCHEPGCPQCHKALRTNHGPNWRARHQASPSGRGCVLSCHDSAKIGPDMCRLCHTD